MNFHYISISNPLDCIFSNCGHLALLFPNDEKESLDECPICKPKQPFKSNHFYN